MGGPNLEIFKFSIYLFVPIAALVHFGDPEWYRTTVVPVRVSEGHVCCEADPDKSYHLQYRDKLFPSLGRLDPVGVSYIYVDNDLPYHTCTGYSQRPDSYS